jgi:hypothetical protein
MSEKQQLVSALHRSHRFILGFAEAVTPNESHAPTVHRLERGVRRALIRAGRITVTTSEKREAELRAEWTQLLRRRSPSRNKQTAA